MRILALTLCLFTIFSCAKEKIDTVKTVGISVDQSIVDNSSLIFFLVSTGTEQNYVIFPKNCTTTENCPPGAVDDAGNPACKKSACGYEKGVDTKEFFNLEQTSNTVDFTQEVNIYACLTDADGALTGSGKAAVTDATAAEIAIAAPATNTDCATALASIPQQIP